MLFKGSRAIKPIMTKKFKYLQLHCGHHTLISQQIKFSAAKDIIHKTENSIKENDPIKILLAEFAKVGSGFPLFYSLLHKK